jgi:hypothetical protein
MTETADGAGNGDRGTDSEPDGDIDSEPVDDTDSESDGDTFGVGIHVTEAEFQFVVHVPSDIDPGWTDPEAFQRTVERVVWDRLDREATLREIYQHAAVGETVTIGRITLEPNGTVFDATFSESVVEP